MHDRHLLIARSVDADTTSARLDAVLPALRALDVVELTVTSLDGPPAPVPRVGTAGERFAALISLVGPRGVAEAAEAALAARGFFVAAYRAETAEPVSYTRTWPVGDVSPGLVQLTFLRRKPGLDDAAFIAAWHGVHTPLAIEIHPLWRYTRHTVREVLTEEAPAFEGIVELHFRSDEDVTDPARFYGGDVANAKRIAADVRSWIDFGTIEVVHGRQRVLR